VIHPPACPASTRRVVYLDANPLSDRHLTGIGRYTARIAMALHAAGAEVRFFSHERQLVAGPALSWDPDQDLLAWARQVWSSRFAPLDPIPAQAIGLYTCTRPPERRFGFEISILHDLTPLLMPWNHTEKTRADFQYFFGKALLSSDAALAVSHSTRADAHWLTDLEPHRIAVAHSGPTICVNRHLHAAPVARRPEVGLVVSTLEPRKNAFFLLDWFRESQAIPAGTELWWVGPMGWMVSKTQLRAYERSRGHRVRFLGVVSDQELCRLYQQVGWSIYPSLYEGFGFPVLDALRHGTPVLTSANSSLVEFQVPGVYLFDPCQASTLDTAFQAVQAARGQEIPVPAINRLFSWDRVSQALLQLPETVTVTPSRTHRPTIGASRSGTDPGLAPPRPAAG
jgi:alpha-1,3-rhamnosyl/mannosyltransferase